MKKFFKLILAFLGNSFFATHAFGLAFGWAFLFERVFPSHPTLEIISAEVLVLIVSVIAFFVNRSIYRDDKGTKINFVPYISISLIPYFMAGVGFILFLRWIAMF